MGMKHLKIHAHAYCICIFNIACMHWQRKAQAGNPSTARAPWASSGQRKSLRSWRPHSSFSSVCEFSRETDVGAAVPREKGRRSSPPSAPAGPRPPGPPGGRKRCPREQKGVFLALDRYSEQLCNSCRVSHFATLSAMVQVGF